MTKGGKEPGGNISSGAVEDPIECAVDRHGIEQFVVKPASTPEEVEANWREALDAFLGRGPVAGTVTETGSGERGGS